MKFLFGKNKKNSVKCVQCNIVVYKDDAFVLKYKASDGEGEMNMCKFCAGTLDEIIEQRDNIV